MYSVGMVDENKTRNIGLDFKLYKQDEKLSRIYFLGTINQKDFKGKQMYDFDIINQF